MTKVSKELRAALIGAKRMEMDLMIKAVRSVRVIDQMLASNEEHRLAIGTRAVTLSVQSQKEGLSIEEHDALLQQHTRSLEAMRHNAEITDALLDRRNELTK